jgi:hypothetical protein
VWWGDDVLDANAPPFFVPLHDFADGRHRWPADASSYFYCLNSLAQKRTSQRQQEQAGLRKTRPCGYRLARGTLIGGRPLGEAVVARNEPRLGMKPGCPLGSFNLVGGRFSAETTPKTRESSWERDFRRRRLARKKGLKMMSPRRDQKLETSAREKWPQKRPFCW